jgi:hypothetical protein
VRSGWWSGRAKKDGWVIDLHLYGRERRALLVPDVGKLTGLPFLFFMLLWCRAAPRRLWMDGSGPRHFRGGWRSFSFSVRSLHIFSHFSSSSQVTSKSSGSGHMYSHKNSRSGDCGCGKACQASIHSLWELACLASFWYVWASCGSTHSCISSSMVDFEGFGDGGKGKGGNVRVNTGKDGGAIVRDGVIDLGDG